MPTDDKAHYYPDAAFFITKLIADRATRKAPRRAGVSDRARWTRWWISRSWASTWAQSSRTLRTRTFAYAPPFSTAIHPFVQAVYVLMNKLDGTFVSMTPAEYAAGKAEGYRVVDVQPEPAIRGAFFVNLAKVNGEIGGLDKKEKILLVCAKRQEGILSSRTGCATTGMRIRLSWRERHSFNDVKVKNEEAAVSKED